VVDGERKTVSLGRVFIPSKLGDNRLLLLNDPTYVLRLTQSGSEQLVKAWLEGDWSIIDGAYFDIYDPMLHVLPFETLPMIPKNALRFRAFDWGSYAPFCCGWYAIADGTWGRVPGTEDTPFPAKAMIKYREWYGSSAPGKGLKMQAPDVADGILNRERQELIRYGVCDPAMYIRDGGPSIAEAMSIRGCNWRRADNKRIPGWEAVRQRLSGILDPELDKMLPLLYFVENCEDTIRTFPFLQHDDKNPEDVDTEGEDHAGDETRYACMSRPWLPAVSTVHTLPMPQLPSQMTINEIMTKATQKRKLNQMDAKYS